MKIEHFTDLVVWQKSRQLFKEVYELMRNSKEYYLRDQILRATLSISNNIAEGFGRYSKKEFIQFLNIAKGSLNELESMMFIMLDMTLIDNAKLNQMLSTISDIRNLNNSLIHSILRKIEEDSK